MRLQTISSCIMVIVYVMALMTICAIVYDTIRLFIHSAP